MKPLVDGHGRPIGDVRVSVTDRCNFRCGCMPADGMNWVFGCGPPLSFEEIGRVVRIVVAMGVRDVRLCHWQHSAHCSATAIARVPPQITPGMRGFSHAPEWTRTITGKSPHKALNLVRRCKICPGASGSSNLRGFTDASDAS
jgi:hypothetical protein